MERILNNEQFAERYRQLSRVTLNPRRHTAANALAHSEAVAARAAALALANGCAQTEVEMLEDLGRAHDIGKITGTARPERSLDVLHECGIEDPAFLALVRWHDTSLPWYRSHTRAQPPTEKAWRRLASEVDLRLLCLFMVADRVDAPPGWRRNAPTVWFLEQARERRLISNLRLDVPGEFSEVSAGGAVVRQQEGRREVLLIRVRAHGYELPKGAIEWDELPTEAAIREIREEAAIDSPLRVGDELGAVDYSVGDGAEEHTKRARYFLIAPSAPIHMGPLPPRTRERRWLTVEELTGIPLVNESLRPILRSALEATRETR